MLRSAARISCSFAVMFAATFALAQAEFSAEVVDLQKPGTPSTAKIYFATDKMRVEATASGAHVGGAAIVNFAKQTTIILMPQQHMYMEMPAQTQLQKMGYAFFQAGDVENACAE